MGTIMTMQISDSIDAIPKIEVVTANIRNSHQCASKGT
jgi:hypothetical protein